MRVSCQRACTTCIERNHDGAASDCQKSTDLAGQLHARVRPWVHSCDSAALSGWVYIQYDALDRLLFDSDMRHGTLLGRCSTQSGARHRRATIGLYRLNMRQFGLRRLIISAARACGAQLIGFFHSNMRHLGLRRLIISAARATGAHTIGFFRIDMRHFGMVARIVVRANHTNSATFDGRNNYRSKRRPNAMPFSGALSRSE